MENLCITKLKIILHSKIFYLVLLILAIIAVTFNYFKKDISIYDEDQYQFELMVKNYKIKEDKIVISLVGKEELVGTYYFQDKEEIEDIKYGSVLRIKGKLKEPNSNSVFHAFNEHLLIPSEKSDCEHCQVVKLRCTAHKLIHAALHVRDKSVCTCIRFFVYCFYHPVRSEQLLTGIGSLGCAVGIDKNRSAAL